MTPNDAAASSPSNIDTNMEVSEKRKQAMTVRDAIHVFKISQRNFHRKRTTDSYRYLLEHENRRGLKGNQEKEITLDTEENSLIFPPNKRPYQ
jgi:hypothetical protein